MKNATRDKPDTAQKERKNPGKVRRLRVCVRGAVQGVGFRPSVYRLAFELHLRGWVKNTPEGAVIEAEGPRDHLESFLERLQTEKPPRAFFHGLETSYLDPLGYKQFEIRSSDVTGRKSALILPDIATCPDCLREIMDPNNRRYRYPFTNCTNCGPRFSIITALPYDRVNTTMRKFRMCDICQAEYDSPLDRRFHAQPNACPRCGPHLELWDPAGRTLMTHEDALRAAILAIRDGQILALKGLGGFHLIVDARSEDAVRRLRTVKAREEKPLALMFPSVTMVETYCELSAMEERLMLSPEAPIVLLRRNQTAHPGAGGIADSVAPGNPFLGIMLPYTPLHHLLLSELGVPVVATSGNRADETICTDENEALSRLSGIADLILIHDRPIERHVDDSIVRVMMGRELVLRRARGYAPLPVHLNTPIPSLLAVGGHLKNTVAWSVEREIYVSQHIGDLETVQAFDAFQRVVTNIPPIHDSQPVGVACDLHPDYLSTRHAESTGLPVYRVQHHYAHVLACMADNDLRPPVLGVAWDGTGYGADGTIWGGEFLRITTDHFDRVAHFRTFPLPGGEAAVKEPRRAALGLLYELFGDAEVGRIDWIDRGDWNSHETRILRDMLRKGVNSPRTSSAGRLFDAVAALIGIRSVSRFEGQAAMELEFACEGTTCDTSYPFLLNENESPITIDWGPMVRRILEDRSVGRSNNWISAVFHNTLAQIIVAVARRIGLTRVALSGGCFQNRYLTERAVRDLTAAGMSPYWHQRIPPNDGGISLGQVMAASQVLSTR